MAYSPPLSLLSLAPVPPLKRRPRSILSDGTESTLSTLQSPPPSSYHRRSRSAELLKGLTVLAPTSEIVDDSWELVTNSKTTPVISFTMTAPQAQTKKPGFFRRLSMSNSQPQAKVQPSTNEQAGAGTPRSGFRSTSGPVARHGDVVAGPSYESYAPRPAPSSYRNGNSESPLPTRDGRGGNGLGRTVQGEPSRPSAPTPIAASFVKPRTEESPTRPVRARNPIHPALASPPNSPPRHMSGSSPYDATRQSSPPQARPSSKPAQRSLDHQAVPADQSRMSSGGQLSRSMLQQTTPRTSSRSQQELGSPPPPKQTAVIPPLPNLPTPSAGRPTLAPLAIPSQPPHRNGSRSMSKDNPNRQSRFDDADGPADRPLPPGAQPSATAAITSRPTDPRGVVSARRSTSSSRRTPIAKIEKQQPRQEQVAQAATPPPLKTTEPSRPKDGQPQQLSEASAYAKSFASRLGSPKPAQSPLPQPVPTPTPPPALVTPKPRSVSRPLPAPPAAKRQSSSGATMIVIASSSASPKTSPKQEKKDPAKSIKVESPPQKKVIPTLPSLNIPKDKRMSSKPLEFDFPRSPTLPPLVDPRSAQAGETNPIDKWSESPVALSHLKSPPLPSNHLPPRVSSAHSRRVVSSPLASPRLATPNSATTQSPVLDRRHPTRYLRGKHRSTLAYVLTHSRVQAALLPHLSINSFLSLTGASDVIRKRFTGESVGRWVLREWGVRVDREKGRSWPNLTVWEGFLESLLHDPSTYSTYSPQWYSLLQHLCLSHSLIVLHLRQLPVTSFPNPPPLAFEDDFQVYAPNPIRFSNSVQSFASQQPRSRMGSTAGSDAGSVTGLTKMPRQERLVEIIMPEPLAAQPPQDSAPVSYPPSANRPRRRSSIGSIASAASFSFGRRRTASIIQQEPRSEVSPTVTAAPMPSSGKAALPPVSYPMAKRYGFKRHGEPTRTRPSSDSSRPGSIFSVQSSPSMSMQFQRGSSVLNGRASFAVDRNAPPVPGFPAGLPMPPPIGGNQRSSFGSEAGKSSRRSDHGGYSPVNGAPYSRRDINTPSPARPESAFDRPIPYTLGRVPILRVFVPLSERVQRWPSAEGGAAAVKELEKCGALRRMKMGDLVVNTAIRQPKTTEHVLIYVPHVRNLLIPLDYTFSPTGHLPVYINGFDVPPSYYHPFLPTPQILFLDLAPFANQAMSSLRLAYDRRDVTVASGARMSAKRYLHVSGFEIGPNDRVAPEWQGTVSLETEGTAEGKMDLEKRLIGSGGARPIVGAWEVVRDKSILGTIWLRLVKDVQRG